MTPRETEEASPSGYRRRLRDGCAALLEIWGRLCECVPAKEQDRPLFAFLGVAAVGILLSRIIFGEWPVFMASAVGAVVGIVLANQRAGAMVDNVRLTRFKDAVGMLGGEKSSVLVGAVYALHEIAEEEVKLRRSVFHVLCELVRKDEKEGKDAREIALVARQTALQFLFGEDGRKLYSGRKAPLSEAECAGLDLSGLNFTGSDLTKANFENAEMTSSVNFSESRLNGIKLSSGHNMHGSDFSGADMRDTAFLYVHFENCNFAGAQFRGTSFDGCFFHGAENLTEDQLALAKSLCNAQGLPEDLKKKLRRGKPALFEKSLQ